MSNIMQLDLNLLRTLNVLLAEHNVTRAAQRLNLSQPSVSVQLAKLREHFADPLLLPGPRGMQPTARGEALREPLRQALDALEHAVNSAKPFDPSTACHTWRLAASDYSESTILLPALAGLRTAAPATRIAVLEIMPPLIAKQLEQGDIDLAFHVSDGAAPNLRRKILFKEEYVLVGRKNHPQLQTPLTRETFCSLDHVIVSCDGGGFFAITDQVLAEAGLTRRVVLSVPHFLFIISALTQTDLVAMLPARLVRHIDSLQVINAPISVPGYEMSMLWHERSHRDPAHQWLREYIAQSL